MIAQSTSKIRASGSTGRSSCTPLVLACLAVGSALAACSVDARTLRTTYEDADGGAASTMGGSSSSGGAGHAGAGHAASAGEAGISGANTDNSAGDGGTADQPIQDPISTSGGCADLDEDQVPDCQQGLLSNATFDSNVSKWSAETRASLTWDPRDALGDSKSGSALLTTASVGFDAAGSTPATASQCLPVTGGNIVAAYANAIVESGQAGDGVASVDVFFFDAADCTGTSTTSFSTPQPLDSATGTWLTLKAALLTSAATHSALVKLTVAKPFQADSFHARFDNVLVKQITPQAN